VHSFCPVCGTSVCAHMADPDYRPEIMAINVRTIVGIDVSKLSVRLVDGRKGDDAVAGEHMEKPNDPGQTHRVTTLE